MHGLRAAGCRADLETNHGHGEELPTDLLSAEFYTSEVLHPF